MWFSQSGDDLLIDFVGTSDRVTVDDWYLSENYQIDEIQTDEGMVLVRDQVDQLVTAMAAFAVPQGVGAVMPQETSDQLYNSHNA